MKLPKSLRAELKKPLGTIHPDIDLSMFEKDVVVCVGDQVTWQALDAGINPKIIVYDGLIKRQRVEIPGNVSSYGGRIVELDNPAATLNTEVFPVIEEAFESDSPTRISVDGEEDLIALAVIKVAPIGVIVLYGQPDEGVVVVRVDESVKIKVEKYLRQMEEEHED